MWAPMSPAALFNRQGIHRVRHETSEATTIRTTPMGSSLHTRMRLEWTTPEDPSAQRSHA